jgi:WD40 repeat protein
MLQAYVTSPRPLAGVQYPRPPVANPVDAQNDVYLARDGRTALVPLPDGAVAGYDVVTGVEFGRLTGHAKPVRAIALTADGRTAVTGDDAGVIKVWDRRDGSAKRTIEAHAGAVRQIVISPVDDTLALSAGDDRRVRVWNLATGERLGDFASRNGDATHVEGLAFTPHGQSALSATHGGEIIQWDLATGATERTVARQTGQCFDAPLLSPDGQLLIAGSPQGRAVRGWDFATGRARLGVVSDNYQPGTRDASWPGQRILTGDENGGVHLWDFAGRRLATRSASPAPVLATALADDGRTALAADKSGRVTLWDLSNGNDLLVLRGHRKEVLGVAVSPDGLLAASAGWDGRVYVWDVTTGHVLRQFGDGVQRYWSVAFGPGAATVIAGSQSGMLSAWDLATGMQLALAKAHGDTVTSMALSPDGKTLVTGSSDSTVRLWNAADVRQAIRTLRGHSAIVRTVAFSADGDTIVSGGYDASMILWDAGTGARRRTIKSQNGWVNAAAFSPDERWILSGNRDGSISFWEAATGTLRRSQSAHDVSVSAVAFTPDGRTAASGGEDKLLRLWDVASGRQIHAFAFNGGPVKSIVFTQDRAKVVWCSLDGTVGVLDFGRPAEYAWFDERLPKVTAALQSSRDDPAALLTLGRWYAFRGADGIAVDLLTGAQRGGAKVPHLTLARTHWRLGNWEHARAAFTRAGELGEAPQAYIDLCIAACTPAGGIQVERATATATAPLKGSPAPTRAAPTPPKR